MKKKSRKTIRESTLQTFEMVPITDPAEIAELERRIREYTDFQREVEAEVAARWEARQKEKARKKK
jgi:hypothetical protein